MQAKPSSPLFSVADESTYDKSRAANDAALSGTTHHEHTTSQVTAAVKSTPQLPKPSSNDVGKETVKDSVAGKRATSLFNDEDDDLFASPAPSKVAVCFII